MHPEQIGVQEKEAPGEDVERAPQKYIDRLITKSRFRRSTRESADCEVELRGEHYRIETIARSNHPDLPKIQQFLYETFQSEELLPDSTLLRNELAGKNRFGLSSEIRRRLLVLRNEKGEIITALTGALLPLKTKDGVPDGRTIYLVDYAVTRKDIRQRGFAREVYISALIDAMQQAKIDGQELAFVVGEAVSSSERYLNQLGRKRIYVAAADNKRKYAELKHIHPGLAFDDETGEPLESEAEHLMLSSFGGMPTKEDIIKIVRAINDWYKWPQEYFKSRTAYENHLKRVDDLSTALRLNLQESGQLILLDSRSREKARQGGIIIEDHIAADRGKVGPEDF